MLPRLVDTHTHVQFHAFKDDADLVIQRALDSGVWMINVGTQKDTSAKAVEFAHKHAEGVYATVGLHPIHTEKSRHDPAELGYTSQESELFLNSQEFRNSSGFVSRGEEFDFDYYKNLAQDLKVVAIGECGLDYYRFQPQTDADLTQIDADGIKGKQKKAFEAQIALADEVKKPMMIHCRNAFGDLIDILVKCQVSSVKCPGIVHFFSGTKDDAQKLLDLGFSFSFGGVITFTRDYDEVVKYIPLERILLETDAPYVAPVPYRGKRNEPAYVAEVAKKLAELKSASYEDVAAKTSANALRIFGLMPN